MNFRQLDLNLLRVLAAVDHSRSVTAAGRSLSLSQPATSNALARLRRHFGDELFVRTPAGLQPTRLCERVAPAVRAQLQSLEAMLAGREEFDPARSDMHWRVSLSDLGEMLLLPALAQTLRREAPGSHLSNIAVASADVAAALEARDIDCAIGILHTGHRGVRAEPLFREPYVAVAAPGWRPAGRTRRERTLTPEQLARAWLVVAAPAATSHGSVEQMLVRMKLTARIVLRVRHFASLPELALRTDLLAIVPTMYANHLSQRGDLRVWRLAQAPYYDVRLLWHIGTARDPAHEWMRARIRALLARVDDAGTAVDEVVKRVDNKLNKG